MPGAHVLAQPTGRPHTGAYSMVQTDCETLTVAVDCADLPLESLTVSWIL